MRQFDIRNSWLDNDGKPLVGRATFCKLHTTVNENIYDVTGTVPLANPQYTNTLGQLVNQVFLKDNTDYTVRFEKYVGNGDMSEDQDNWLFQYSCDNLWDTYGIEVEATSLQLVNNIADLRQLDPSGVAQRGNRRVIALGGYYEVGDKPQVYYYWEYQNISSDNGGSVIAVDGFGVGRWVLLDTFGTNGIDVRHFGVFGADTKEETTTLMSTMINNANQYAASIGSFLYFPNINGVTWYKINGQNIYGPIFAEGTKVCADTNYPCIITMTDDDNYLDVFSDETNYKAVFTIRGPIVKTSWGVNSNRCIFDPSYKLIIDSVINTNHKDWSDIIIDCQNEISYAQFDGCIINAVEKLGDYTSFQNCRLEEKMFIDSTDFDSVTVSSNDIIDLDDWPTTSKWLKLRTQCGWGALDMNGRTLDSTCAINWANSVSISNAVFDNFTLGQNTVGLERCAGTLTLSSNTVQLLVLDNSEVSISYTSNSKPNVTVKNGSKLTLVNAGTMSNVDVSNSEILGSITADGNLTVYNSKMVGLIYVYGSLDIRYSTIQNAITHKQGPTLNVILLNNVLNGQYRMSGADYTSTIVNAKIESNISNAEPTAIVIDRTYIDLDDSHHTYSYKNNTGSFIQDKVTTSGTYVVKYFHWVATDNRDRASSDQGYHVFGRVYERGAIMVFNQSTAFENCTFFTIGTSNVNVKMNILTMKGTGADVYTVKPLLMAGQWTAGFTYGLVVPMTGIFWPTESLGQVWDHYPSVYSITCMTNSNTGSGSDLPSDYNMNMIIEYEVVR